MYSIKGIRLKTGAVSATVSADEIRGCHCLDISNGKVLKVK